MTAFDFSLVANTSFAFDPAADTISFGTIGGATLTITDDGTNTTITDGTSSVTLQGVLPTQFDTANFLFTASGGKTSEVVFGDNNDLTGSDDSTADTITDAATADTTNNQYIGFGGADNINLTGTTGDNLVYGGSGAADSDDGGDTVVLGSGSSTLFGNAGNDTISWGNVVATGKSAIVYGGSGDDSVTTGAAIGDVSIVAGLGGDTVNAVAATASSNVTIIGGNGTVDSTDGADSLTAGLGSGQVFGNGGNDTLSTGATASGETISMFGGAGNDSITNAAGLAGSTASLVGGLGGDTITGGAGTTTIIGGNGTQDTTDGADSITAGAGDTTINSNAGNDTIVATAGDSTIHAGQGNDSISVGGTVNADTATVTTGLGNDTITFTAGGTAADSLIATLTDGNDVVNIDVDVDALNDQVTITGFDGANDILNISMEGGNATGIVFDSVAGTLTDTGDVINFTTLTSDFTSTNLNINGGGELLTNVFGTAATTLTGGTSADQLISGGFDDTLIGGAGSDNMTGGNGNDVFQTTSTLLVAGDTIDGGAGTADAIALTAAGTALADAVFANKSNVEVLEYGNFDFDATGVDTLSTNADAAGIRTIDATALTGTNNVDIVLQAGFTADVTFNGGAAGDTVNGTALTAGNQLTANGGAGADQFTGGADADSLTGNGGADILTGGAGADTLYGNASSDSLTGDAGADILYGGADNDTLIGGADNDTLVGGEGADTLTGGTGADVLTGGNGADRFVLDEVALADADTITEFVAGSGNDVFAFSDADLAVDAGAFTASTAVTFSDVAGVVGGNDTVNQIIVDTAANIGANGVSIGNQSGNTNNVYQIAVASDTGAVFYDADGDWTAGGVQIATVTTLTGTLHVDNFVIVA